MGLFFKFTVLILILLQLLYRGNSQATTSRCDAVSSGGRCYSYFTSSGITWANARSLCLAWGGDLATVTSSKENTLIYNTATQSRSCWIGLNDRNSEGTWVWVDGSNSTYTHWEYDEPNSQGNEDCVCTWGNGYDWNDLSCGNKLKCHYCSTSEWCGTVLSNRGDVYKEVKYYNNGEWYYLCSENFTETEANLICEQYEKHELRSIKYIKIEEATENIATYPYAINCSGNEDSLCNCSISQQTCSSGSIAAVECRPPANGDLRLMYGSHGLLEFYYNQWGYVCDHGWNIEASNAACRSLGYRRALNFSTGQRDPNGNDIFTLDDVTCIGGEVSLLECYGKFQANCGSNNHVDLTCGKEFISITSFDKNTTYTLTSFDNFTGESFVCAAEGVPPPDVYWTINFNERIESSLLEVTSDDLPNATNVFYCVAESSVGRSVLSVTFNVRIPPLITSPNQPYTTTLTSIDNVNIPIECRAGGTPTPNVYWTHNNAPIQMSSTLMVTGDLLTGETNTFQCVAENEFGRDMVSVTYVVEISTEELAKSLGLLMENLTNAETISDENAGQTAAVIDNSVSLAISNTNNTVEQINSILEAAANTVELIVNKTNGTFSNETANIITNVLGTIVSGGLNQTNQTDSETATNEVGSVSTAVGVALRTLETFSSRLNKELLATPGTSSRIVESEAITIVVQVVEITESDSLMLPLQSAKPVDYSVSLSIPSTVAKSLSTSDNRLAIATSFVKRIDRAPAESGFSQASDILTTSIAGRDGKISLAEEVSFEFEITSSQGYQSVCVSLEGTHWVRDGLRLVKSTTSLAVCNSIHFTSFAVFVTPYQAVGSVFERTVLSALSYLLLGISFISLLVSLIIFCIAGKAFFKVETNIIYFNSCLAMLLAVGLFLFGVESGTFDEIVCKIIAFALHYAWLAVLTWTLCIGILIMFKLVFGVMSNRKIYPYLIVFGWAFPLLIPLITITIATVLSIEYVDRSKHCFLSPKQHIIWAFIAPVIVIILINIVFLIIAISRIIYNKWGKNDNPHKDIVRDALVTGLVLTPVLGIPWIVLILNVVIRSTILEYIFIILNGLIGLVFLLVVVIRNREVQTIFKRRKAIKGSGAIPSRMLSSSVTASSTVSCKFKKTGADKKNTLESALEKEGDIEVAAKMDSGFETFHVYENPIKTMEKVATPDVQTLLGGLKGTKRSDQELFEVPPPLYEDVSDIQIESDMEQNPSMDSSIKRLQ